MTLRVRISIVPFGDEEKEREIHQINISNLGAAYDDLHWENPSKYGIELDKYKTEEYDAKVLHYRSAGALTLVEKAIRALDNKGE